MISVLLRPTFSADWANLAVTVLDRHGVKRLGYDVVRRGVTRIAAIAVQRFEQCATATVERFDWVVPWRLRRQFNPVLGVDGFGHRHRLFACRQTGIDAALDEHLDDRPRC